MLTHAMGMNFELDVSQKSVLFVAHPAHELLVHHWMEQARPCVLILTDGTGSSGPSRIASSRDNILNTGARPGSLFGDYTDADIYRHILDRDVAFFAGILDRVVATLVDEDADLLVSDPVEHYSPAHDLCAAIAFIARTKAAAKFGRHIVYRQFPIEYRTNIQGTPVILSLEPAAIARKLAAAHAVPGVADERARLLAIDPLLLASESLW